MSQNLSGEFANEYVNKFVYDNLEHVTDFSKTTSLWIHRCSKKLYVVKTVPHEAGAYYRTLQDISNPALANIVYISEEGDFTQVVREYISGDSLSEILKTRLFETNEAITTALDICGGLVELHRYGFVHRDITPNNIIMSGDCHPTIIDFGIMRSFQNAKSSDTVIMGTPGFAAPEQFGFAQSNPQTDIYAVGVLLNVMLTGQLPVVEMAKGPLAKVIEKCTRLDPKQRYSSMEKLCAALHKRYDYRGPLDSFIKIMPGVRSRYVPVTILAFIAYILVGIITIESATSIKGNFFEILRGIAAWILIFPVPFVCLTNFLGIWDRLAFSAGSSRRSQRIIYYGIGLLSLFAGLIIFGISNVPA